MRRKAHATWVCLPLIAAVLALSGCQRTVELQLAADVRQASEIEAALGADGIEVERKSQKGGVMLYVARSALPRAMHRLREAGLLRPSRASVDDVLGKRGIAQTPLDERIRRVHAIERELEATLMNIDGVVTARVRIVPPERPAPGAPLALASASVLVTHRAGVDMSPLMPGIARLVKNGAPGLAGEDDRRVAVMLVPEQPIARAQAAPATGVVGRSTPHLIALVCGSAAVGYFFDRLRRRAVGRRAPKRTASARHSDGGSNGSAA
jgi:type III secretion protein J